MAKIRLTESELIDLLEEVLLVEAMSLDDIHTKHYPKIPGVVFRQIIEADPTYNPDKPQKMGKYGKWLLSIYQKGKLKLEDLYKASEYLSTFKLYSNKIEQKDINQYGSLQDLYRVVKPYIDNPHQATSKSDEIRRIKDGAEKAYEDEKWLVIIPHTKEAAIEYGKGTQWCTAATKSNNYFDFYNEDGNLYINILKGTNKKYQFHFESNQFMDVNDEEIDYPIAKNIGLTQGAINFYLKECGKLGKILTKTYNPAYVEPVIGLEGYSITSQDRRRSLLKYDVIRDDYDVIYRLPNDRSSFTGVCLKKRFMMIRDEIGSMSNLFDVTNNQMLFNEDDEVHNISHYFRYSNYVCCEMGEYPYYKQIYSLEKMDFVYKINGDPLKVKPLDFEILHSHYKDNIFSVVTSFYYDTVNIIDVDTGNIIYEGYYDHITTSVNGRHYRFVLLSKKPNIRMDRDGSKVLLYDGTLIDYDKFKAHEEEIVSNQVKNED